FSPGKLPCRRNKKNKEKHNECQYPNTGISYPPASKGSNKQPDTMSVCSRSEPINMSAVFLDFFQNRIIGFHT
ncbi:TPA: hypothetical protein ACNGY5_002150, partial [Klebsiella michiganensis]